MHSPLASATDDELKAFLIDLDVPVGKDTSVRDVIGRIFYNGALAAAAYKSWKFRKELAVLSFLFGSRAKVIISAIVSVIVALGIPAMTYAWLKSKTDDYVKRVSTIADNSVTLETLRLLGECHSLFYPRSGEKPDTWFASDSEIGRIRAIIYTIENRIQTLDSIAFNADALNVARECYVALLRSHDCYSVPRGDLAARQVEIARAALIRLDRICADEKIVASFRSVEAEAFLRDARNWANVMQASLQLRLLWERPEKLKSDLLLLSELRVQLSAGFRERGPMSYVACINHGFCERLERKVNPTHPYEIEEFCFQKAIDISASVQQRMVATNEFITTRLNASHERGMMESERDQHLSSMEEVIRELPSLSSLGHGTIAELLVATNVEAGSEVWVEVESHLRELAKGNAVKAIKSFDDLVNESPTISRALSRLKDGRKQSWVRERLKRVFTTSPVSSGELEFTVPLIFGGWRCRVQLP